MRKFLPYCFCLFLLVIGGSCQEIVTQSKSIVPDFSRSEWELVGGKCSDWSMHRGEASEYKFGYYWHYHNTLNNSDGAMWSLYKDTEMVLIWLWRERGKDETVTTFLYLEEGRWIKGKLGVLQQDKEIKGEDGKIKKIIRLIEADDGEVYQRVFNK